MIKQQNSPHKWLQNFPFKKKNSHKYSRGQLIVVGGKKEMIGATLLSAEAALRTGVGSVKIICDKQTLPIYSLKFPSLLKKEINNFKEFKNFVIKNKNDTFLIGPGIGSSNSTKKKVIFLLKNIINVILDADAINCVAQDLTILENHAKELIMTPHPGEMGRLAGTSVTEIQKDRVKYSSSFALDNNLTLVLKGWGTIISNHVGKSWINTTGNSGMSVAGMGDVLAGMIGTFKAQEYTTLDSCIASVFLHGSSGDLATKSIGNIGIIPSDLIKFIPIARANI